MSCCSSCAKGHVCDAEIGGVCPVPGTDAFAKEGAIVGVRSGDRIVQVATLDAGTPVRAIGTDSYAGKPIALVSIPSLSIGSGYVACEDLAFELSGVGRVGAAMPVALVRRGGVHRAVFFRLPILVPTYMRTIAFARPRCAGVDPTALPDVLRFGGSADFARLAAEAWNDSAALSSLREVMMRVLRAENPMGDERDAFQAQIDAVTARIDLLRQTGTDCGPRVAGMSIDLPNGRSCAR